MTESIAPDDAHLEDSPLAQTQAPSSSRGQTWLGLLARYLLILSGCGLAFLGGSYAASHYPTLRLDFSTPFLEQLLHWNRRSATPNKIVLPSDSLFYDAQSSLRPKAYLLLDNFVPDLRTQRGSTIMVIAHTDDVGEVQDLTQLSFQQARAIREYLHDQLGDGYRWVAVGKGSSEPLVENSNNGNRRRNRRVEITIVPH